MTHTFFNSWKPSDACTRTQETVIRIPTTNIKDTSYVTSARHSLRTSYEIWTTVIRRSHGLCTAWPLGKGQGQVQGQTRLHQNLTVIVKGRVLGSSLRVHHWKCSTVGDFNCVHVCTCITCKLQNPNKVICIKNMLNFINNGHCSLLSYWSTDDIIEYICMISSYIISKIQFACIPGWTTLNWKGKAWVSFTL